MEKPYQTQIILLFIRAQLCDKLRYDNIYVIWTTLYIHIQFLIKFENTQYFLFVKYLIHTGEYKNRLYHMVISYRLLIHWIARKHWAIDCWNDLYIAGCLEEIWMLWQIVFSVNATLMNRLYSRISTEMYHIYENSIDFKSYTADHQTKGKWGRSNHTHFISHCTFLMSLCMIYVRGTTDIYKLT